MGEPSQSISPLKKEELEAAAESETSTIKAEEKPTKEQRSSPVTRSKTRLSPVKDEEVEVVEPPEGNKRDAKDDESQQRGSNKKRRT